MKYGNFDDSNREYVITTPKTPLPWINYLGNRDFFSLISNTAGGYSFYRDAKLMRLTRYRYNNVPTDTGGRYYYINDSGTIWNPGWQPVKTQLDSYTCRHGMGYTIIESEKNQLSTKLTCLVPIDANCELNQLILVNNSDTVKEITLTSFLEFCLWDAVDDSTNFQRNFSIGELEVEGSEIYHKSEYRERRNHYSVFSVNSKIDGYDTSRDDFCGEYLGLDKPDTVFNNNPKNTISSGWAPVGSHHIKIVLQPNENKSFIFLLGYIENQDENKWQAPNIINKELAKKLIANFDTDEKFNQAFFELKEFWDKTLSKFSVNSADEKLNRMVNIWNQYQCMVTFNLSRSASYFESGIGRGMGFRDSCQDLLGFVHLIPDRARQRILDIASTQFEDGSAYHQYQPLTKRGNSDVGSGFNDDPLWLIAGTIAYLKETADFSILDEKVPFDNDESLSENLMEHLRRSLNYTLNNIGPHELPLIGRADWNDCLNLNTFSKHPGENFQTASNFESGVAESVFIAGMFVLYGNEYAKLCKYLNLNDEEQEVLKHVEKMKIAVSKHGWDGEWFLRAYDAFSKPIGSSSNDEGKIFIESQGMCVLAGIGLEDGKAELALKSVEEHLDTDYGIVLHYPAYSKYHLELGEISSYPPGYKENGGIFCHNNPWLSCAETLLGHGNRAFEIYKKITPAYFEERSSIHRCEPYVYCQMIAGKEAVKHGEAKNSWLTGTAAWNFVNITQYILGIKPDYDGLVIEPCIPQHLTEYSIQRTFRNTKYNITIQNPLALEKGKVRLIVDGIEIDGNLIAHNKNLKERNVIAYIEK